MAETITIPSPSVFLSSPVRSAPPKPATTNTKKQQPSAARKTSTKPTPKTAAGDHKGDGVTKPKQSKSRNGCVTCKAKRLKCDETKPTCQQCSRRGVPCGGYKKDYKWRPFGEATFVNKPPPGKSKKATPPTDSIPAPLPAQSGSASPTVPDTPNASFNNDDAFASAFLAIAQHHHGMQMPEPSPIHPPFSSPELMFPMGSSNFPIPSRPMPVTEGFEPSSLASTVSLFNDADTVDTIHSATTAASSLSSGNSPELAELLMSGRDLNAPPPDFPSFSVPFTEPLYQFDPGPDVPLGEDDDDDDVEEIVRADLDTAHEAWVMGLPTAPSYASSRSSEGTVSGPMSNPNSLLREPAFGTNSPEMLAMRYDRRTCGVLSVKDGPSENPWRTLIWPLAKDSPALFHAIGSLTSFHMSKEEPELRVQGIDHMRKSIEALANGIEKMRLDTAIATTLALAFSESWDTHTSTGIDHIKGAKILVHQALVKHKERPVAGDDLARLKFLCNSWVYMDVIARLTSVDDDESNDFDSVCWALPGPAGYEELIDPLMGCASTLFPIIGRVANLVRKVQRSTSNSPAIISQAMELKDLLENWMPPSFFEEPEDPTSQLQHSIQTAEAYRFATLLYMHQAVPEIPSLPSSELARKVLNKLATVPLNSRTVIVQIFPLTAAGCEAVDEETRQWVRDRWAAMGQRMNLGIIDRCMEVVKEVWDRRDAYETQGSLPQVQSIHALKRGYTMDEQLFDDPMDQLDWINMCGAKRRAASDTFDGVRPVRLGRPRKSSSNPITGEVDPEFTVRGSLHWLGVMKDWQWEVLLG